MVNYNEVAREQKEFQKTQLEIQTKQTKLMEEGQELQKQNLEMFKIQTRILDRTRIIYYWLLIAAFFSGAIYSISFVYNNILPDFEFLGVKVRTTLLVVAFIICGIFIIFGFVLWRDR